MLISAQLGRGTRTNITEHPLVSREKSRVQFAFAQGLLLYSRNSNINTGIQKSCHSQKCAIAVTHTSSQLSSFSVQTKDCAKISVTMKTLGEGRPAALFLHDFMTDSRLFQPLFAQTNFPPGNLIACDLRGYGRSTDPTGVYSHIDDIDTVLDHLGIERVHLVGAGMGGVVALEYAISRENKTNSVAIFGSGLPGYRWSAKHFMDVSEARFVGRMRSIGAKYVLGSESAQDPVRWKQSFISNNETWVNLLRNGDKQVAKRLLSMAKTYRGYHFFMADPVTPQLSDVDPLRMRLGEVQVPALVAVGKNDSDDFQQIAKEISERVGAQLFHIDDARHFVPLEQPFATAELLKQFWSTVSEGKNSDVLDSR